MNSKDRLSDRNVLEARLREEALSQSPRHSDLLHERIMQRIGREPVATSIEPRRGLHWAFIATAAAAMVAILVPAMRWWSPPSVVPLARAPHITPASPSPIPPLPPFDTALASALEPASEHFNKGRYAYLDQDAQRFSRFVTNQFDVWPMSR